MLGAAIEKFGTPSQIAAWNARPEPGSAEAADVQKLLARGRARRRSAAP